MLGKYDKLFFITDSLNLLILVGSSQKNAFCVCLYNMTYSSSLRDLAVFIMPVRHSILASVRLLL